VSNVPAYPKKLPTVLIATLTTLVISAGFVLTKELLAAPAGGAAMPPQRAPASTPEPEVSEAMTSRMAAALNALRKTAQPPSPAFAIDSFEDVVHAVQSHPEDRQIAVFGAAPGMDASWTALKFARALGAEDRVIMIGLGADAAIRAAASDPSASGLAELADRTASFCNVIVKDRQSGLHLISSGQTPAARNDILMAPGIATSFDALARAYDRVVIAAGATVGADIGEIAAIAPHAILAAGTLTEAGIAATRGRLLRAGFSDVTVLGSPSLDEAGTTAAAA